MEEQPDTLARVVAELAEAVVRQARRLSGSDYCPWCGADRSNSWRHEAHRDHCLVARAEALATATVRGGIEREDDKGMKRRMNRMQMGGALTLLNNAHIFCTIGSNNAIIPLDDEDTTLATFEEVCRYIAARTKSDDGCSGDATVRGGNTVG